MKNIGIFRLFYAFGIGAMILILSNGCGKKTSPPTVAAVNQTSVIKTVPWEGAKLMPLQTAIIIDFSNPLSQNNNGSYVTITSLPSGQVVTSGTGQIQANYLYFTPSTSFSFSPLSYYRVTLSGTLDDENGRQVVLPADGLTFSFETQGDDAQVPNVAPTIANIFPPLPGEVFTNAVFRFTFSQPISQTSILYGSIAEGNTIEITDTTSGKLVEVTLSSTTTDPSTLIPDNAIVLQPVSGLVAGDTYQLVITDQLYGANGVSVSTYYNGIGSDTQFAYTFTPASAGVEKLLNVYLDPAVELDYSTGLAITTDTNWTAVTTSDVPVNVNIINLSALFVTTYITGYQQTYMGDASVTPNMIPIIIPTGQRLFGSSLYANGAPLGTGLLTITQIDNVTLFMAGNPYQQINNQAPPVVYGVMDLNLGSALVNADLMGVQLSGTTTVDKTDGSLIIDFVGTTTINLLGYELPVTLFLRFRSVPVGWVAPSPY